MTTQTRSATGDKAARQDPPARTPRQDRDKESQLDEDLEGTFPASDPPSSSVPETSIGWDAGNGADTKKKEKPKG